MATLPPIARPPRPSGAWEADRFELFKWFDLVWRHLGGKTTSSTDPATPPVLVPPVIIIPRPVYPDIIIPITDLGDYSAPYEVNAATETTIIASCGSGQIEVILPSLSGYTAELCIKHNGTLNSIMVKTQAGDFIEGSVVFIVYPGESINVRPLGSWWIV
jgi:hypothetical protein